MAESIDPRIAQLNSEIERNKELIATQSAFRGFGRSTDAATKVDNEIKKGSEVMQALVTIITLENIISRVDEKSAAPFREALSSAQGQFQTKMSELQNRRTQNIQDILSYDQEIASEGNDKIKIGKSTGKLKKLSGKIKTAESKFRTKSLDRVKPAGDKDRKIPSLSKIQSLERAATRINSLKPL